MTAGLFVAWLYLSSALTNVGDIALGLKDKAAARCAWVLGARASMSHFNKIKVLQER